MVSALVAYWRKHRLYLIRFLVVGSTAAALNLGLMYVLVEFAELSTVLLKNVANVVAMEVSVIYNFILSRYFTWSDVAKHHGLRLVGQAVAFHAAIAAGLALRVVIFPVLQSFNVPYLLNVAFGIGLAAVLNFFVYNHLIFRKVS